MSAKKMLWPYTDRMVLASVPVFETVFVRSPNQIDFSGFNSLYVGKKDALAVHGPWWCRRSFRFFSSTDIAFLSKYFYFFIFP
jgi:hypothetical protein